jgi:hypothetical protein
LPLPGGAIQLDVSPRAITFLTSHGFAAGFSERSSKNVSGRAGGFSSASRSSSRTWNSWTLVMTRSFPQLPAAAAPAAICGGMRAHQAAGVWKATSPGRTVHFTCDRAGFIASATSIRTSGALALSEPAGQVGRLLFDDHRRFLRRRHRRD